MQYVAGSKMPPFYYCFFWVENEDQVCVFLMLDSLKIVIGHHIEPLPTITTHAMAGSGLTLQSSNRWHERKILTWPKQNEHLSDTLVIVTPNNPILDGKAIMVYGNNEQRNLVLITRA